MGTLTSCSVLRVHSSVIRLSFSIAAVRGSVVVSHDVLCLCDDEFHFDSFFFVKSILLGDIRFTVIEGNGRDANSLYTLQREKVITDA